MTRATAIVSGCFSPLHVGDLHVGDVRMTRGARELAAETCDRLGNEIVLGVGGQARATSNIGERGL